MDSIWGNIFKTNDERQTRALLRDIPLFANLSRRELTAVEQILYRRQYAAGEIIFRQSEPGVGMYIVLEGTVAILYEPTGVTLAELRHGEFFGEIALLNETPRSATARALSACTLLGFFQPELLGLLKSDPGLGVKILLPLARIAGQRLIHADAKLLELHEEIEHLKAPTHAEELPHDEPHHLPLD